MLFSQRIGKKPAQKLIQKESIDTELRNSLWSALTLFYWKRFHHPNRHASDSISGSNLENLITALWLYYFKSAIDTIQNYFDPNSYKAEVLATKNRLNRLMHSYAVRKNKQVK